MSVEGLGLPAGADADTAGPSEPVPTGGPATTGESPSAGETGETGDATWSDAGELSGDTAPSASGTSEGSDLSTPNIDTGSSGKA
jgi:hypothetical protein